MTSPEVLPPQSEREQEMDNMMKTVARQALMITAYERVIEKQCVMIEECERSLQKVELKLAEKERTVGELARINYRQCSALAKFRTEKEENKKELRKNERCIETLILENECLRSLAAAPTIKRNHNAVRETVKELKHTIEETRTSLLAAIAKSKNSSALAK
jgi:hypothetical protein